MLLNLVKADHFEWKVLELVSLNFDNFTINIQLSELFVGGF